MFYSGKDFRLSDELRLPGIGSEFLPEIYIVILDRCEIFLLHPTSVISENKIFLEDWPTADQWKDMFYLFRVSGQYEICCYLTKIVENKIFTENPGQIQAILNAAGYSNSRFDEILFVASLQDNKKRLFEEKRVPAKILRLLTQDSERHFGFITEFLLLKELNSNTVKEILLAWLDLNFEQKEKLYTEYLYIFNECTQETMHRLGDQFRKALNKVRFPDYNAMIMEMDKFKHQLTGSVEVEYDPFFEEDLLNIRVRVSSKNDLRKFWENLNNNNIIILENMINLINKH